MEKGKLEITAAEGKFLGSMVDLNQYDLKDSKYSVGEKPYVCDPCDACGPDACASCDGCVES